MAFVVSDGSLRAIERAAPPPFYAMRVGDSMTRDYAMLWRVQPELRTVVDFVSRNIAQLGLHAFRRVTDVDRVRLVDHPLVDLIDRPNPSTTRFRLINALVHDLCIFDDGYLLKVRVDGQTLAVRRVRPQRIVPVGSDWLEPEQYEVFGSRGSLIVPASSVVHFHGYNPTDDRVGAPPIESLRQILSEEWASNTYREQLWRNGARTSGFIERPAEAPDWGTKGRERFRAEWDAQYTGNGAGAGSTPILEDGMKYVPSSTTPRDSQYIEGRKLTREEVARTFHVPLPMVGILDHATFSNIREQHKQLYQDCLGPWLQMIVEDLELQLLPDVPDTEAVYLEFNFAEKLRGSFEEQAAQLQASVGAPYMTRNEARSRLNLPRIEGSDELIVPLNVGLGSDAADPQPPVGDDAEPKAITATVGAPDPQALRTATDAAAHDLAKFYARQAQAILSALGARKAGDARVPLSELFDAARWDDELSADLLRINQRFANATPGGAGGYEMAGWLSGNAIAMAKVANAVTAGRLAELLPAPDPVGAIGNLFAGYAAGHARHLAIAQAQAIAGPQQPDADA